MFRKTVSVILVVILSVCACVITPATSTAASYRDQIKELERKQEAIKSQIADLQDDIDEQEKYRDALQEQIDNLQDQIDIYNEQITEHEKSIKENKQKQKDIEAEIETKKDLFLERIRALYISGSGNSSISILLGADNFSNYLYQDQLYESITKYDNKVMDDLRDDITELEAVKAESAKKIESVNAIKSDVVAKQAELSKSQQKYIDVINKLEGKQSSLEGTLDEYQEKIDDLEDLIEKEAEQARQESISSNIKWPCPNYYYITSRFGPRWGRNHNGIDIAGSAIYGKPIIAAADGQVTLSSYNGGGYGNYVMINHGNDSSGDNYVTLYAHMSSKAASVGQWVSAGDIIGYVGSTGYSTGPHLHFEIRVNGSPRNPLNWFNNVG